MPINRARIREYLDQDEGDPPPVFVGHGAILEDVLDIATRKAGRPKVTRIVQGAPGAGKSSLLHEMQKRWTGADDTPRVVEVSSEAVIQNTSGVIRAIMAAGLSSQDGWRNVLKERFRRIKTVGASVAGYGLSAEFDVYADAKLISMAMEQEPKEPWNHTVVLAVDEAQALKGNHESTPACFLREIHNGRTGLPLVLVLAGLSDTEAKAREMHLTRGRKVHEVPPLTEFQARDFIRRLAMYLGLDISRHNPQLEALADICDGWPRHLRYAGVSLAEEALRVDGNMHRMDWPAMRRMTWTLRQEHYSEQSSTIMQDADILTARVMSGLHDGMRFGDLQMLVEDSVVDRPRQRLPEGESSETFLNHLIHQGALYRNPKGRVHSPIPSFRSFLIEKGGQPNIGPDRRNDDGDDGTDFSA